VRRSVRDCHPALGSQIYRSRCLTVLLAQMFTPLFRSFRHITRICLACLLPSTTPKAQQSAVGSLRLASTGPRVPRLPRSSSQVSGGCSSGTVVVFVIPCSAHSRLQDHLSAHPRSFHSAALRHDSRVRRPCLIHDGQYPVSNVKPKITIVYLCQESTTSSSRPTTLSFSAPRLYEHSSAISLELCRGPTGLKAALKPHRVHDVQ